MLLMFEGCTLPLSCFLQCHLKADGQLEVKSHLLILKPVNSVKYLFDRVHEN